MSGGTYINYPSQSSGGGGGGLSSISFSIGLLDGIAANPNGASVSSNSIFLQSATAVFPGLINSASQTFGGAKTFNSLLTVLGTSSFGAVSVGGNIVPTLDNTFNLGTPGLRFANSYFATSLLVGSQNAAQGWVQLLPNGITGGTVRFGFNAAAWTQVAYDGVELISNDFLGYNGFSFKNAASPNYRFFNSNNVAQFTLTDNNLSLLANLSVNGIFTITGTSSSLSQVQNSNGSSYSITWPPQQGANNTFLGNNGSGALLWGSPSFSGITGSVSLTNQVSGVLPNANMSSVALGTAAQVTGSITLTNQVVGVLPNANMSAVAFGNAAQVTGSVSLATQVIGSLTAGFISGGTNGQTLTISSGSAVASWITNIPTKTLITALGSSSYTTPANCKFLKVTAVGGGGGGGGCATAATSAGAGGGGGGGGGGIRWFSPTPGQVFAVSIGAGGPGGASGNNSGVSGSFTVFGSLQPSGGSFGTGSVATSTVAIPSSAGAGGAGGGDIVFQGGSGFPGIVYASAGGLAIGGLGGTSIFAASPVPNVTSNSAGSGGLLYGGGGNGGCQVNNGGNQAGGNGGQGAVLVEEFYS